MMTSNYARLKGIPAGMTPIAISRKPPYWYKGKVELDLAPTAEMLAMSLDDYNVLFDQILAKLDPREMFDRLGDNAVLLCWESPNVSCHRRRVAEWFEQHLGIVVTEVGFDRSEIVPYAAMPLRAAAKSSRPRAKKASEPF